MLQILRRHNAPCVCPIASDRLVTAVLGSRAVTTTCPCRKRMHFGRRRRERMIWCASVSSSRKAGRRDASFSASGEPLQDAFHTPC